VTNESSPETTGGDLRDVLGMGASSSAPRLTPGQVIDAYRIEEEVGAGGMGRVYRAHDQRLGRDVALKLHARPRGADELVREAAALARLAHPNVVTVHEVGTWAGHPWVAMELVRGGTARAWARSRTADEILALYRAAGAGLAAAHAAGLVHRDFKPDNVLVGDDGRARVADFGLAVDQVDQTVDAATPGTPGYMAPEQRAATTVDARADQYAFAVSLWEALAGEHPFSRPEATTAHTPSPAPAPTGKIPRRVQTALRRALASDPAKRWPSMDALLAAIAPRRSRVWMIAGGLAILGLGAAVFVLATRSETAAIDCEVTAAVIDAEWSPPARDAVRTTLQAGEQTDRVIATTEAWVARWRAGSRAACEVREQSPALYDQRVACLERGRLSLRAMLATFAQSKLAPTKALDVATALPKVEDCADVAMLVGGASPPRDPVGAAIAAQAETSIAKARTQRIAGDVKGAIATGRSAVAYADAHQLAPASARARIELAAAIHASGTLEGVRSTFEEAVKYASEARDDTLVARAWINLATTIALRLQKPEEADQLILVVEAAVVRAGNPPVLVGLLAGIRGDLALARNRYAEAVPLFEQQIVASEALYGPDDVDQTRWRNRLAQALVELGRFDEARAQLARAAAIIERQYGSTHANLGVVVTTRGQVEYSAGNYAAAIADYQRALAIKTTVAGPEHASLAPTLINLSLVEADAGALADARVHATRGAAIAERTLPPMHPNVGLALATRGRIEAELGAPEAKATLDRAIEILTKAGGRSPLEVALGARSLIHVRAKRLAEARADATRAVEVADKTIGPSLALALAHAALAEVEHVAGDLPAARASYALAIEIARKHAPATHPTIASLVAAAAELPHTTQ
jgi:tetratricopeptide (TPR) repeat protein